MMNKITGEKMLEEMTKLSPDNLNENTKKLFYTIMCIINKKDELIRETEIKNAYLQLIMDIGYEYDRFNDVDNLKLIIDDMIKYAKMAIDNDDESIICIDGNENQLNILDETIEREVDYDN